MDCGDRDTLNVGQHVDGVLFEEGCADPVTQGVGTHKLAAGMGEAVEALPGVVVEPCEDRILGERWFRHDFGGQVALWHIIRCDEGLDFRLGGAEPKPGATHELFVHRAE